MIEPKRFTIRRIKTGPANENKMWNIAIKRIALLRLFKCRCHPFARARDDRVLDAFQIDTDVTGDRHIVFGCASRHLYCVGACNERLRQRAEAVDAGAADEMALDDRNLMPCRRA